jgi:hypothetical protein
MREGPIRSILSRNSSLSGDAALVCVYRKQKASAEAFQPAGAEERSVKRRYVIANNLGGKRDPQQMSFEDRVGRRFQKEKLA